MAIEIERYRVHAGEAFQLADIDPDDTRREDMSPRDVVDAGRVADLTEMRELHERLFAEKQQALLIVMLAIDTGGKDSTIQRVFSGLNPQGCRISGFGVPTSEERSRDFLWRIHANVPPAGIIGVFNRSHYEDVTVPRVHGDLDRAEWERRYANIRDFERLLADNGTAILKFHLRISKGEQAERLQDRLEDPTKHWKFDPSDLTERQLWDQYQQSFEDALIATTAEHAPWYVIPANRKWYRDAIVARVIVDKLRSMDPQYPPPVPDLDTYHVE